MAHHAHDNDSNHKNSLDNASSFTHDKDLSYSNVKQDSWSTNNEQEQPCNQYGNNTSDNEDGLYIQDLAYDLSQGQGIDCSLNQSSVLETFLDDSSSAQDMCDMHGLWTEQDLSAGQGSSIEEQYVVQDVTHDVMDTQTPSYADHCTECAYQQSALLYVSLSPDYVESKSDLAFPTAKNHAPENSHATKSAKGPDKAMTQESQQDSDNTSSHENAHTPTRINTIYSPQLPEYTASPDEDNDALALASALIDSKRVEYIACAINDRQTLLTSQLWQIPQPNLGLQTRSVTARAASQLNDRIVNRNMYLHPELINIKIPQKTDSSPHFKEFAPDQHNLILDWHDVWYEDFPMPKGQPIFNCMLNLNTQILDNAQLLSFVYLAYERSEVLKIDFTRDPIDQDEEYVAIREPLPTSPIIKPIVKSKEPYVPEYESFRIRRIRRKARAKQLRRKRIDAFVEAALNQGSTIEALCTSYKQEQFNLEQDLENEATQDSYAKEPSVVHTSIPDQVLAIALNNPKISWLVDDELEGTHFSEKDQYSEKDSAQTEDEGIYGLLKIPLWLEVALAKPDEVDEEDWDDEALAPFMDFAHDDFDLERWFQTRFNGEDYEEEPESPFPNVLEPYYINLSKTFDTDYKSRAFCSIVSDLGVQIRDALRDPNVTEVMVNTDGQIFIESTVWGVQQVGTLESIKSESIMRVLASLEGQTLNLKQPILSGELPKLDSRFEGLLPPLTSKPAFSIRRHHFKKLTMDDLKKNKMITEKQSKLLLKALDEHLSIVICGATGSGKTTLLNCLICEIADRYKYERIVTIEDTPELRIPSLNKLNLYTSDHVGMSELVRSSLRLRPDRLIVGEVRGAEALDLIDAFSTGHKGGLTSVHAGSVEQALNRLTLLISRHPKAPRQIEPTIGGSIDMVVVIQRRPFRHISQIARIKCYQNHRQKFIYDFWDDQGS